jgi:pimeloyl-ACP methyl ester carboxylesterase
MKKVYFITGLGADSRVFSFLDLSYCEPDFLEWIPPQKNEPLQHYALRLRQTIKEKDPLIVGISFGGMLASEMAKAEPGIKAIIISSNKSSKEFPSYLRVGKYIPVYKWMPFWLIKSGHAVYSRIFGTKGKEEKKLMKQIIADSDPRFIKWAIQSILHWKSNDAPANIIHIHGTADILLPYRLVKADYTIKGGKHVMPLDKHKEISPLLKKIILNF